MNNTSASGGAQAGRPGEPDSPAGQSLAAGRSHFTEQLRQPPQEPLQKSGDSQPAAGLASGFAFCRACSALLDEYFSQRILEIDPRGDVAKTALVAVGGYGRSELCLHSDVDIIIVSPKSIPARALDLAQPLFLPLWDMGLDLGHGFRTIKDCTDLAKQDMQVLASLLDARRVAGDDAVFQELRERMQKLVCRRRKKVLAWLAGGAQHGGEDGAARLEPDLKNGPGGLRDYHRMLWLSRLDGAGNGLQADAGPGMLVHSGLLDGADARTLEHAVDFLLAVRNQLHSVAKRRTDTAHLDLQPQLAKRMGFVQEQAALDVEHFLARLHRSMYTTKAFCRSLFAARAVAGKASQEQAREHAIDGSLLLHNSQVQFAPGYGPAADPAALLRCFAASAQHGARLSLDGRRTVAANLDVIRQMSDAPDAVEVFLLLVQSGAAFAPLEDMLETGALAAFLPELGAVQDLVQFDAYHAYPLARHCLHVVRHLEELHAGHGPFGELWRGLEPSHRLLLLLAALLHDVGKGGPAEEDHAQRGEKLARIALQRWSRDNGRLDQASREDVCFLIREHILLAKTSQRMDLGDETVVSECMGRVGTLHRLRLLYLLTYADSRATGPRAWNEWTARLLRELYFKGANMLEEGELTTAAAVRRQLKTRDTVRSLAAQELPCLSPPQVEARLEAMDSRYTQSVSAPDIVRHISLSERLQREIEDEARRLSKSRAGQSSVVLEAWEETEGVWEVTIAAADRPGLFAVFAGVLALHDLNIYAADCFTWRGGTAMDIFHVSPPRDPLYADEFWGRVCSSLRFALQGKLALADRLDARERSPLDSRSGKTGGKVRVRVDTESTDFFTVIEIQAPDRPGLLYRIAETLRSLALDVRLAKISTRANQVVDLFYVRDVLRGKVTDPARLDTLHRNLTQALTGRGTGIPAE